MLLLFLFCFLLELTRRLTLEPALFFDSAFVSSISISVFLDNVPPLSAKSYNLFVLSMLN